MSTVPPISVGLLLRNTPEGLGRCLHALIVAYADITTSGPVPELAAPADIGMHRVRIEKCEDESMLIGLSKTAYRVLCIDMFSDSATLSLASGAVRASDEARSRSHSSLILLISEVKSVSTNSGRGRSSSGSSRDLLPSESASWLGSLR